MRDQSRERAEAAFPLLRNISGELETYAALLIKWQRRINLVGPSTLDAIWWRHFADSIQLLPHGAGARVWCDLGSGAGFPGMVLALALGSGGRVHLVESDSRKAAFLREVSRETSAPVVVHAGRIEVVLPDIGPVDVVTARALAEPRKLIEMSSQLFTNGARGLFLVGREGRAQLTAEGVPPSVRVDWHPSLTGEGAIMDVTGTGIRG